MLRRIAITVTAVLLTAAPAQAQRVEASFSYGYTASEGIDTDNRTLIGQLLDSIDVESGSGFNFTLGVFATDQMEIEFLWARQSSNLVADGPGGTLDLSELDVDNYHVNFVYNWGARDARVRPFLFGGVGATKYSFGDFLPAVSSDTIESETRFSTTWGGGVKFYFAPSVGAKAMLRWTPTYIKSDPAGVWCDPFFGCWQLVDNQYANQFETSFGVTVRFE